jgi:hypothetical protein
MLARSEESDRYSTKSRSARSTSRTRRRSASGSTRDIAIGIIIVILLINGRPRLLGWLMLAISSIPVADSAIVLRSGAPKPVAYGVLWTTAAVMLVGSVLLIA